MCSCSFRPGCCLLQLCEQRALLFLQVQPGQQLSLQRQVCLLAQLQLQDGLLLASAPRAEGTSLPADTVRPTAFIAKRGMSACAAAASGWAAACLSFMSRECFLPASTARSADFIAKRGMSACAAAASGQAAACLSFMSREPFSFCRCSHINSFHCKKRCTTRACKRPWQWYAWMHSESKESCLPLCFLHYNVVMSMAIGMLTSVRH